MLDDGQGKGNGSSGRDESRATNDGYENYKMRPADNVFELYRLGAALVRLSKLLNERPLSELTMNDVFYDLAEAGPILIPIVQNKFIPLDTCKANAARLSKLISDLQGEFISRWSKAPDDQKAAEWAKNVGFYQLSELKEAIQAFEYVFSAEVANASLYFVEQIGAYQTRTLIETADVVFPQNIRDKLPKDAITDIRAAGRSLAFELPTAAGFHICRAIETTLLQYFADLQITLPKYRNLARYIEALEKDGKEKGVDPKVLATLDQFRDLHRNPIMHPEVHLRMDEAQILFALAQSAISGIVLDITRIKESVPTITNGGPVSVSAALTAPPLVASKTKAK